MTMFTIDDHDLFHHMPGDLKMRVPKCVIHKLGQPLADYVILHVQGKREHTWRVGVTVEQKPREREPVYFLDEGITDMCEWYNIKTLWMLSFKLVSNENMDVYIFKRNGSMAILKDPPPALVNVAAAQTQHDEMEIPDHEAYGEYIEEDNEEGSEDEIFNN
ncbi:hypothetical protein GH714_039031 [Hevea brasiliensis]|uniref:TF-B3 domain-containing protein n=1 Tax=Hevea brasiliensis TaxID=3981 RepID=A0A6A6NAS5_HEVBR|nr:hypothetical protein GH714_039031 [Hevea brasiliensis]